MTRVSSLLLETKKKQSHIPYFFEVVLPVYIKYYPTITSGYLVSGWKPAGDFQASRKIERIAGKVYRETFWKLLWKFSGIFEQMFKASRRSKSFDYFSRNKNSKKLWRKLIIITLLHSLISHQLRLYSRETYANAKILLKTMFCFNKVQRALRIHVFCQFVYYTFRINLLVTSLGCLNVFGCRKTRRPFFIQKLQEFFCFSAGNSPTFFPAGRKLL
jgi:hypothetical protein